MTARLPSNAPVTVPASGRFVDSETMQEIMRMHDALKPDTVYLLHNHPSGNVKASAPDIKATQVLAQFFGKEGINFGGHIIIDNLYMVVKCASHQIRQGKWCPAQVCRCIQATL